MKTEVKNPLNGVTEILNFPCSESRISDALYNYMKMDLRNPQNGEIINIDELNFIEKSI